MTSVADVRTQALRIAAARLAPGRPLSGLELSVVLAGARTLFVLLGIVALVAGAGQLTGASTPGARLIGCRLPGDWDWAWAVWPPRPGSGR